MGYPRGFLIDEDRSSVVHCVSRCVRRASLIKSPARCEWLVSRFGHLSQSFAIDICDFAVMHNHVHLLVRTHPKLALAWSDEEVARRWLRFLPPKMLRRTLRHQLEGPPTDEEIAFATQDPELIAEWRWRLSNLGWHQKGWKAPAARAWNREGGGTGHFWEERYKSIVCTDDNHALKAAAYLLLNPVHCGLERELIESSRTSMGQRLRRLADEIRDGKHREGVARYESALLTPAIPCCPGDEVIGMDDIEWSRRLTERTWERARREVAGEEALLSAGRDRRAHDRAEDAGRALTATDVGPHARVADRLDAPPAASVPSPDTGARETEIKDDARMEALPSEPVPMESQPFGVGITTRIFRTFAPKPPPRRPLRSPEVGIPRVPNPWRGQTTLPMADGCTLLAFVELVDDRGRVKRRDKRGRIAEHTRRAVDRLRLACGIELDAECDRRPRERTGVLAAVEALLEADRAAITRMIGKRTKRREHDGTDVAAVVEVDAGATGVALQSADKKSSVSNGTEVRIAWRGTLAGDKASAVCEAARRGTQRVQATRPRLVAA